MSTNTENFKTEQKAKWADGKRANGANFAQLFDAIARLIEEETTSVPATDISATVKEFLNTPDKYNSTDAVAKLKELMKNPQTLVDALNALDDTANATQKNAVKAKLADLNPNAGVTLAELEQAASGEELEGLDEETRKANERAGKISAAIISIARYKPSAYYFKTVGAGLTIKSYNANPEDFTDTVEVVEVNQANVNGVTEALTGIAKKFASDKATQNITDLSAFAGVWILTTLDGSQYIYNNNTLTLTPASALIG